MTVLILTILILISFLLFILRKFKATTIFFSLTVIWLMVVGQGWLPQVLLAGLQTRPRLEGINWQETNAIVLLGIGVVRRPEQTITGKPISSESLYSDQAPSTPTFSTHPLGYSRVFEAARLYHQCRDNTSKVSGRQRTCQVIISGGDPRGRGVSEAKVMASELTAIGVDSGDILLEEKSNNTFQNARFTSRILKEKNFDVVILVTSGTHLSRSLLYFSHFNIQAWGAPSDHLERLRSWVPRAHNFTLSDIALHEYFGFARYFVFQFMGWNSEVDRAGVP